MLTGDAQRQGAGRRDPARQGIFPARRAQQGGFSKVVDRGMRLSGRILPRTAQRVKAK
jgi:hypothetical protein